MRIEDHKLAWRWTDPNYCVLADSVLAQMYPVSVEEASSLFERFRRLLGADALADSYAQEIFETNGAASASVSAWLFEREPLNDLAVSLSWDEETAILTKWGVFASHWEEFCYPGSDDLVVAPAGEAWALLYRHDEQIVFGRLRGVA